MVEATRAGILIMALASGLQGCVAHRTVLATGEPKDAVLTLSEPLRCPSQSASFVLYRYDIYERTWESSPVWAFIQAAPDAVLGTIWYGHIPRGFRSLTSATTLESGPVYGVEVKCAGQYIAGYFRISGSGGLDNLDPSQFHALLMQRQEVFADGGAVKF